MYRRLFDTHFTAFSGGDQLRSFCHGDSHGGNFIIVRYQYALTGQEFLVDRVFLNEIFDHLAKQHLLDKTDPSRDAVLVSFDKSRSQVTFDRLVGTTDHSSILATRSLHHEIHPIDLDTGTGTSDATKVLHLYDALLFSISLQNITTLFATAVLAENVLLHYYDGLDG